MATAIRSEAANGRRPRRAPAPSRIHILANSISERDPRLAREVESEALTLLASEQLGPLEVRFRLCAHLDQGMRFICKVENPPSADPDEQAPLWRWWSPLMETAQDFRAALREGLQLRRERLAAPLLS